MLQGFACTPLYSPQELRFLRSTLIQGLLGCVDHSLSKLQAGSVRYFHINNRCSASSARTECISGFSGACRPLERPKKVSSRKCTRSWELSTAPRGRA